MDRVQALFDDPIFLGVFSFLAYRHLFSERVQTTTSAIVLLGLLAAAVTMLIQNTDLITKLAAALDPSDTPADTPVDAPLDAPTPPPTQTTPVSTPAPAASSAPMAFPAVFPTSISLDRLLWLLDLRRGDDVSGG